MVGNVKFGLAACVVAALALSGSARAELTPADFVVVGDEAYGMLTPDLVAAPYTVSWSWSPNERYVAVVYRAPIGTAADAKDVMQACFSSREVDNNPEALVIWSNGTGRSHVVWSSRDSTERAAVEGWFAGTDAALVSIIHPYPHQAEDPGAAPPAEPPGRLVSVTAAAGNITEVAHIAPHTGQDFSFSPKEALAVETDSHAANPTPSTPIPPSTITLQFLAPHGPQGGRIQSPEGMGRPQVEWSADGSTAYALYFPRDAQGNLPPNAVCFRIDSSASKLVSVGQVPPLYTGSEEKATLHVTSETQRLQSGDGKAKLSLLWLENSGNSVSSRALICIGADKGDLSPRSDAVIYRSQGAAWVRRIVKLSKVDFQVFKSSSARKEAMSNAVHVALAEVLYADDHAGVYPSSSENVKELLKPYVRDNSILDDVVYTFPGGPGKDVAKPWSTEIGYIPNPDGRVVMYLDGHVEWKSNY